MTMLQNHTDHPLWKWFSCWGLPQDQYSIWSFHWCCAYFLLCLVLSCQPFPTPETYLLCPLRFTVYCQQNLLDFQSKHFFITFFLQCKPGYPWGFWLPCSILRWSPPPHTLYISVGLRWRLGRTWAEGKILTASLSNFRNFPFLLPNNSPNWFLCTRCPASLIVAIIVSFLEQFPFTDQNSSKFEG